MMLNACRECVPLCKLGNSREGLTELETELYDLIQSQGGTMRRGEKLNGTTIIGESGHKKTTNRALLVVGSSNIFWIIFVSSMVTKVTHNKIGRKRDKNILEGTKRYVDLLLNREEDCGFWPDIFCPSVPTPTTKTFLISIAQSLSLVVFSINHWF